MNGWADDRRTRENRTSLLNQLLITALACAGLLISGFLLYQSLEGSTLPGCGPQSACDQVLASVWSRIGPIPVALPAFLLYGLVSAASLGISPNLPSSVYRVAWYVLLLTCLLILAAAWFVFVQVVFVGSICLYCLTAHVVGVVLGILVLVCAPIRWGRASGNGSAIATSIAPVTASVIWLSSLVAIIAVAAVQVLIPAPTIRIEMVASVVGAEAEGAMPDTVGTPSPLTDVVLPDQSDKFLGETVPTEGADSEQPTMEPELGAKPTLRDRPVIERRVKISLEAAMQRAGTPPEVIAQQLRLWGSRQKMVEKQSLNLTDYPIDGDLDAEFVAIFMFDYTCPHCRKMHKHLNAARWRYGKHLAVVMLPVPLNSSCNKMLSKSHERHKDACALARLLHAVWLAQPDMLGLYDRWVLRPNNPPAGYRARAYAETLVGVEPLQRMLADPRPMQWIERNVDLFAAISGKAVGTLKMPVVYLTSGKMGQNNFKIQGASVTEEEMFELLEKHMKIKPYRKTKKRY